MSLSPERIASEYVFCTLPEARYGDYANLEPVAAIREAEGLTLVIQKFRADESGLSYQSIFSQITLGINSSLDAVGLTAAITSKLTEHGISANVIAGYYHDHIFVHSESAEKAMAVLRDFSGTL